MLSHRMADGSGWWRGCAGILPDSVDVGRVNALAGLAVGWASEFPCCDSAGPARQFGCPGPADGSHGSVPPTTSDARQCNTPEGEQTRAGGGGR